MGNSNNKTSNKYQKPSKHYDSDGQAHNTSQFSLSHFVGNLSGRSFLSVTSNHSVYSASRPWSRVSRRRWNESTLSNPLEASKTAWPVANKESIFLPEFPITTDLLKKDFDIIHTIAKGAFGEVYKVRRLSVNKDYALKVLRKGQVVSESAVRQVKEEARIQEACGHHTFIVRTVSRWQTKKRLYIVSEYIPGGELLALIEKYIKLPEEVVRLLVAEIAIAIDFLHNAGVIYRDLKPENILLDEDYHIQLVDFGLSKWLSVGGRTTTLCGTLKYMAPEVLSGEPYGHAVDWWSLGVLTCRMLTGEFPSPAIPPKEARVDGAVGDVTDDAGERSRANIVGSDPYIPIHYRPSVGQSAPSPGSLPASTSCVSGGARALLMRLLERDPRRRLRSLIQLQQTAFYMDYKLNRVSDKKMAPRVILGSYYPSGPPEDVGNALPSTDNPNFIDFDKATIV